ncbi:TPA: hypothetical protein RVR55_003938, partial [Aeromonas dhakensis]|nr:hypothetical protein [Aeromonas dhakensis]
MVLNFLTAHSLEETSLLAARQISERLLAQSPDSPSLLLVYFTQAHDAEELRHHFKQQFPSSRLIGCSSCGGVMTQTGHHARQGRGVAVAAIYDDKGAYGVAGQAGAAVDVRQLLRNAIADGGRPGELPQLILLHASPGQEEAMLESIEAELGTTV